MRTSLLVVLLIAIVTGLSSMFIIDEKEVAIVTQFGKYKRSIERPGLYFKLPLGVQTLERMDGRVQVSDTPPAEYLTLDKKRLLADPVSRWRILDALLFYKTVHDEAGAKARLDDIINSGLRRELASHNFGDIIGLSREPLMEIVSARVRQKAKEFGITVLDVRIKHADLPKEVQESVFARMRAERERVAKQYRSEGEEEAAKIRADTDKEKTIMLAQAYETSQKSRGEGDAEAIKVYAEAYGKDPEFYTFLRSLDTYEKAMGEQSTMVLSTGSDLFRYLTRPGKR